MTVERSLARYRRMLHLLPGKFRSENGEEMERLFAEALVEARAHAHFATLRAWSSAIWDITAAAMLSRFGQESRYSASSGPANDRGPIHQPPQSKDSLVFESLMADVWGTIRSLRKSPGFSIIAILTLGLGVGATTLVFTVVHSVLMKPLPYENPEQLVNVWNNLVEERQDLPAVHSADFRDYQEMSETFEEFAAASGAG